MLMDLNGIFHDKSMNFGGPPIDGNSHSFHLKKEHKPTTWESPIETSGLRGQCPNRILCRTFVCKWAGLDWLIVNMKLLELIHFF